MFCGPTQPCRLPPRNAWLPPPVCCPNGGTYMQTHANTWIYACIHTCPLSLHSHTLSLLPSHSVVALTLALSLFYFPSISLCLSPSISLSINPSLPLSQSLALLRSRSFLLSISHCLRLSLAVSPSLPLRPPSLLRTHLFSLSLSLSLDARIRTHMHTRTNT